MFKGKNMNYSRQANLILKSCRIASNNSNIICIHVYYLHWQLVLAINYDIAVYLLLFCVTNLFYHVISSKCFLQ